LIRSLVYGPYYVLKLKYYSKKAYNMFKSEKEVSKAYAFQWQA